MFGIQHTAEHFLSYEDTRKVLPEQILAVFGIEIESNNKCRCPFHDDDTPSMLVHETNVYCFGCKISLDSFGLVMGLLEKAGMPHDHRAVFNWFKQMPAVPLSGRKYVKTQYEGAVNPTLIAYWQECMTEDHYARLLTERLITKETAQQHRLGWRPDWSAFSIPFFRLNGEADIVQFRMMGEGAKSKYVGLKGHNRGAIMNADLLTNEQPYVVVFFGSFDAILARQDGLIAVGTNGSTPFAKKDHARIKEMFALQKNVLIVPDNTPDEYGPAEKLAEMLGGEVRFFPINLPEGTDYIDYRRAGKTKEDFMTEILNLTPREEMLVENVVELLKAGDRFHFAELHMMQARGTPAQMFALAVAEKLPEHKDALQKVICSDTLKGCLRTIAADYYHKRGGW